MLILSRKIEEAVVIGDTIKIRILGIQDGQVKIGVEAPKEIKVLRSELFDQIHEENIEASKVQKAAVFQAATILRDEKKEANKNQSSLVPGRRI
jgi:carbon storage regulator